MVDLNIGCMGSGGGGAGLVAWVDGKSRPGGWVWTKGSRGDWSWEDEELLSW